MNLFSILLFISASAFFVFLNSSKVNVLNFFRSAGFLISILIVFTFHLNWLVEKPLTFINASLLVIVINIFLYCRNKNSQQEKLKGIKFSVFKERFYKAKFLLAPLFLFSIALLYFNGNLWAPKYKTPDPGQHFLQMSRSAQTGFLPLFIPGNEMFEASGYNEEFLDDKFTYFPGTSVPFFFIYNVFPQKFTISLQILNIVFYIAIVVYLYKLMLADYRFRWKIMNLMLFLLLALGTFFDFIVTSFTTQLFGLFLLIFFADSFYEFYRNKKSSLPAVFAFSALLMSYVYWIPAALLFAAIVYLIEIFSNYRKGFLYFLKNQFFKESFLALVLIVISGAGYIYNMLKVKLLGYSTADGGFNFADQFISDGLILLPFVCSGLYVFLKKNGLKFMSIFLFSTLGYGIVLYFGHSFLGIVSNYARLKVLYIIIPIFWFFALIGIEKLMCVYQKGNRKNIKTLFKKEKAYFFSILIGIILLGSGIFMGNRVQALSLLKVNIEMLANTDGKNDITKEQLEILDEIKADYIWALNENRMFIVAPYDTALWSFAYAGIWPRTYSLIGEGQKNEKIYSPMSFYSENIADYNTWLKNDKDHTLLYLDKSESKQWVNSVGFNFDDYEVLLSVGDNKLLRLKKDKTTWNALTKIPSLSGRVGFDLPIEKDFSLKSPELEKLSFIFLVKEKSIENDDKLLFSLFNGSCSDKKELVFEKEILSNNLKGLDLKDYYPVDVEGQEKIKASKLCARWQSLEGDGIKVVGAKQSGEIIMQESYLFQKK